MAPTGTCPGDDPVDGSSVLTGQCRSRDSGSECSTTSVCGCDGQTYGNECAAQMAGENRLESSNTERCAPETDSPTTQPTVAAPTLVSWFHISKDKIHSCTSLSQLISPTNLTAPPTKYYMVCRVKLVLFNLIISHQLIVRVMGIVSWDLEYAL